LIALMLIAGGSGPPSAEPASPPSQLLGQAEREIGAGDYAAARRHAREAAERFASAGDPVNQARALNRVGQAALYAGEYGSAAEAFRLAADLSSAQGDTEGQATQLSNLGNAHYFVGRYADADRTYDAALRLVDSAQGAEWTGRRRRIVLVNKAALDVRLGRDQEALEIYERLGDAHLPPDEQAQLLVNKGVLYRRLGDPIKALSTYDQARRLFVRGQHVDGELGAMNNRGIVLALDLQQLDAAERVFSENAVLAERAGNRRELLHARLYRGETRLRSGRAQQAHDDFVAALALARELKTPEEEWKALFGLGRSEPGPELAQEHLGTAISVIEKIRERIGVPSLRSDFFSDKTEVYDALIAARLSTASAGDIFNLLERSHSRAWRDRLGLSQPVELPSVQRALPDRVLLLDYWSSPHGSALVAATRTRAATLQVTVDDAKMKAFADHLASGEDSDWREPSKVLGAEILPPSEWFAGIDHVLVVAAGPLALVPFELLSTPAGLLVEQVTVSYTPTAATMLKPTTADRRWLPPWSLQLQAFGDPIASEGRMDESRDGGGTLPSTVTEVRAIASELAGAEELHLGPDNLKEYLFRPTERASILHIASHASADSVAMERSRILFSPPSAGETTPDYLYLREVYELPLGNVELAVLSACETERGRVVRGEGVQSFSRAFLAAGARSTVTTLWRVADAPTASFMEVFYYHLQRGELRAEALRRTKLRFLQSKSPLAHPHYWGAFVLTGDSLRPIPRALSWTSLLIGVGFAGALASSAVWSLRNAKRRRDR
jgi:CHAT domain-containing protein/tetratricopeptide (TPR) repeat protein